VLHYELTCTSCSAAATPFLHALSTEIRAESHDMETGQEENTVALQRSHDLPDTFPDSGHTRLATRRHISVYCAFITLEFTILAMVGIAVAVGAVLNASNVFLSLSLSLSLDVAVFVNAKKQQRHMHCLHYFRECK